MENPPETEQIFFNRDRYEASRIYTVDWSDIYEYYNLDRQTFAFKIASPFSYPTNPTLFKNIKDGSEYDVSRDERYIDERHVLYKVDYPNEYGSKNSILLVIPSHEWEPLDEAQREQYVSINCYINLVLRKSVHRTWAEISKSERLTGHTFNWVWFRKPGCTKKVDMSSALTWLEHNDDLDFILWTDMKDEQELNEAFGPDFPKDRVNVKYLADTLDFIRGHVDQSFYKVVEDRVHERILIAKTDYLRTLVLERTGGFYCDFNDCVCFCPVRYWFHEFKNRDLTLPCDTYNSAQISNYFIYARKGSKRFKDLHVAKIKKFPSLKRYLCDTDIPEKIGKLYISWALKFLNSTRGHPVKELVKLMIPENGVFNMKLKEAITPDGFTGFKMSDVRARVFFPIYIFKYLKDKDPAIEDFYNFMSSEFLEIMNIDQSMKIHYTSKDHDDSYDTSGLKKFEGLVKELEGDQEFYAFIWDLFVRNMVGVLTYMTNFTLGLKMNIKELVPFGYFMTGVSMFGHYGQGTSLGVFD